MRTNAHMMQSHVADMQLDSGEWGLVGGYPPCASAYNHDDLID